MGPLQCVKVLPAYRRSKSVDCGAYLGVENIVIPAVERLLRLEAGRTAVVAYLRFFSGFCCGSLNIYRGSD